MLCACAIAAEGAAADRIVTVSPGRDTRPIAARTSGDGAIHVLCDTSSGPYYFRSTDDGATFSPRIAVVGEDFKRPAGIEFQAWDMAIGKDGRVHVALGTNAWKLKRPKEEWGLYYARLDRGQEVFSPLVNITKRPSEGFSLAADDRGNVTACWLAGELYVNVSHDGGQTFGEAIEIDPSFNPCDCCTTSCCYGADGTLAVLYREETKNERDMYVVRWDQKHTKATRTRIGATRWQTDSCPMTYFTIVPTAKGFDVAWPTKGKVYFAHLDERGNTIGPAETETPGASGMRKGMIALSNAKGETLVVWKKDDKLGWQLYDAKGSTAGDANSIASQGPGAASVALPDGRFLLFR